MGILLGSANAERDRFDFFRAQVLFWMLCAIDGHARNFSLFLDAAGRYRLTARCGIAAQLSRITEELGTMTPGVVSRLSNQLPAGFPAAVSEPVFAGLLVQARRLL